MDTIALFGATGRTGRRVLERALRAGYAVRALARDPSKLPPDHPRLTVIVVDVLDPRAVERTVAGADAVLNLVGHVKGSPPMLQTDATRNVIASMEQLGIRRLVTLSGGGLRAPEDRPRAADRAMRGGCCASPRAACSRTPRVTLRSSGPRDSTGRSCERLG